MKSIGQQAKDYREGRGWSTAQMAQACQTSRQNIESLELVGDRTPRYIKKLAEVMGTTADALMHGRAASVGAAPAETPAPAGYSPDAAKLAYWFDKLPADSIAAADAHTRCMQIIVAALHSLEQTHAPAASVKRGKLRA